MEEDMAPSNLKSRFLKRSSIQKQIDQLKDIAAEAEELQQMEVAHDQDILFALDIIERFLRRRKRVCYGGTAINAILPKSLKFYDPALDLPDYDFFTPDAQSDIKELVKQLHTSGFTDVVERVGMHEGTHKILVNFVAIADITEMEPELYDILYKRSVIRDGIHYGDPDFLRMMMYLELSRPRGDVKRWEKVYERLLLLNVSFPIKHCRASLERTVGRVRIPIDVRKAILNYVIESQRVLVGADVVALYDWYITKRKKERPTMQWFLKRNGMIVFMSPDLQMDAKRLKGFLNADEIQITTLPAKAELVPERVVLSYKDMPFLMIVKETACHSYNELPMKSGRTLLVGSIDTMLTLYYALNLFTDDEKILQFLLLCLCQKLVEMSEAIHRLSEAGPFPAFSIECSGYQKGYATLLKEKYARIKKTKRKTQSLKKARGGGAKNKTRKHRT